MPLHCITKGHDEDAMQTSSNGWQNKIQAPTCCCCTRMIEWSSPHCTMRVSVRWSLVLRTWWRFAVILFANFLQLGPNPRQRQSLAYIHMLAKRAVQEIVMISTKMRQRLWPKPLPFIQRVKRLGGRNQIESEDFATE
jgi:hypothetical protein